MTGQPPLELSVIVPAFNEEERIGSTLREIAQYLERSFSEHEILVVDDGSTDGTGELVQSLVSDHPTLSLLGYAPNRGKGHAVRHGMLAARGALRLFMDADHSTPIQEIEKLQAALADGAQVAIGSRAMPSSEIRQHQSLVRERMGKTFNLLVRALVMGGVSDTQCGFKLFTAAAAEALFEPLQTEGFAFDVELLRSARGHFQVAEVPVLWSNCPDSRVSPFRDSLSMFLDLIRIRRRGG